MKIIFKIIILILINENIDCQLCALGSYLSNNNCYLCPKGYYCPSGATKPTPCPLGSYSFYSGETECKPCSPGNYANNTASTGCKACPNGYYCKDPSIAPKPCPLGTYSFSNYGVITECKPCSRGYYANNTASTGCKVCPNGYYCKDPSIAPKPCPLGTYSFSNYEGITECKLCSPGYYANNTASTSCKVCPNGYQCCDPKIAPTPCPLGTCSFSNYGEITECKPCSPGYYANNTASTRCKACPNGYQCCDPKIAPTPCPLGTYSFSSGGISECSACNNGYYTDTVASTGCKYCPNGITCQSSVSSQQCSPISNLAQSCSRNLNAEKEQLKCIPSNSIKDLDYLSSVGDCNFYTEMENEKNCGADGYFTRYGFKYCKKFGENIDSFNKEGQKWVDGVRMCLMKKLLTNGLSNCNELESFAFDTHVDCYLNPGHGAQSMCKLLQAQNFIGLWNVYDFKDFLSINAIKQVISVMKNCGSQLISNGIESVNNSFNSLLDSLNILIGSIDYKKKTDFKTQEKN